MKKYSTFWTRGLNQNRISLLSVFQYAFILCLILDFRSIWLHTDSLAWISRLVKLLMGVSVVAGGLARRKASVGRFSRCLLAMGLMVVYVGIWYLFDPLKSSRIITILIQLLAIIVYCMLVEDSVEDTMYKYTSIVLVIAVISLFFWALGSTLKYIRPTGYLYTTWTGNDLPKKVTSYYGIYFETQSVTFFGLTGKMVRNTAIFTEAPMASMIFSTAFLAELLMQDKLNWKRCAILMAAVLSTISTTGYMVVIAAAGLRYVFTRQRTRGGHLLKLVLLPTAFGAGAVILSFLIGQKLGTSSGSIRVDDFAAGYKAWINAPLFGNGYGNYDTIEEHMSYFRRNNTGFSNSPMLVLVYGGIYLFFPYATSMLTGFFRFVRKKMWNKMGFYLVFLCEFIITVCPFQMLSFYLFICMARDGREQISQFQKVQSNRPETYRKSCKKKGIHSGSE